MSQQQPAQRSTPRVARSTLWNLFGMGIPILVAVVVVPILIKGLGTQRFGVLTIAWAVMGYFGLFNFGLGRATTKSVAELIDRGDRASLPSLIWSSLAAHLALGILGAVILAVLTRPLTETILSIPPDLTRETCTAFYVLALSIPVVLVTVCLRSVLEAIHRFDLINTIQIPASVTYYLGPVAVLTFTEELGPVVGIIVALRCVVLAVYFLLTLRQLPGLRREIRVRPSVITPMLGFGGWMTICSLTTPIIATVDRFTIGAFVSIGAVAYYATSYEVVTKLWLFSASLLSVLFPRFSALNVKQREHIPGLYWRAVTTLFVVVAPIAGVLLMFGYDLLAVWVGEEFAQQGTPVLNWLAVGIVINIVAQVPFTLLQSMGKADIPAKLHLIELPLYALAVWSLAEPMGIQGVAIVWTVRATLDALMLFVAAERAMPQTESGLWHRLSTVKLVFLGVCLFTFWQVGTFSSNVIFYRLLGGLGLMTLFVIWEWRYLLQESDRQGVLIRVRYVLNRIGGTSNPLAECADSIGGSPNVASNPVFSEKPGCLSGGLPKVSIVIPAYNHADYLEEAVQSVLNQDYANLELIVLDDGSTDETARLLENYPPGAFHWETQANMGQAKTLNKGWRMSTGSILSYLSADDVLRPHAVSTSVACLLANPDVVLTYCDFEMISPNSTVIRRIHPAEFSYRDMVVKGACQPGPAPFFHRRTFETTGGWNNLLRQMPDYEYWLRLGLVGRFQRIPHTLAAFRIHNESQTFAKADVEKAEEPVRIMTEYYQRPDIPAELMPQRDRAVSNAHLTAAQLHWRAGRYRSGIQQAVTAIGLCPRNLFAYRTARLTLNAVFNRLGHFLLWRVHRRTGSVAAESGRRQVPIPRPHRLSGVANLRERDSTWKRKR